MTTSKYRSSRCPAGSGLFLEMDKAKQAARAAGQTIVDLSVGIADLQAPKEALETLKQAVDDPSTHSYCLKSQTMPLLEAATDWYNRRHGVQLDPHCEALMVIGCQEGLAHMLMAAADHGDTILMADVAYTSYFGAVQVAGLQPAYLPLNDDFLPDFDQVDPSIAQRAKILLLNYPNNPTAATADKKFFARAIQFAKDNDILLVHDAPYVDQTYDEDFAASPLALPGGNDVCVELFTFAKSYHIAGFRLGFALGNRDAIAALEAIKAPIDFNQYIGIQRMGITCLNLPPERLRADAATWQARAQTMVEALREVGWHVKMPKSGMYIWAKLPGGLDDLEFVHHLVSTTGVAVAPGRGFGPGGRGYIRIALVKPQQVLREAALKIGGALQQMLQGQLPTSAHVPAGTSATTATTTTTTTTTATPTVAKNTTAGAIPAKYAHVHAQ